MTEQTATLGRYEAAEQRVDSSEALGTYRDIILEYDWAEGAEHYDWVATAPEAEILDWAVQIREAEEAEREVHAGD